MRSIITAEDAYAVCEGLAEARTLATARTAYGDGYRAAAEHIAAAIRAQRSHRAPSELERDLRDAEVEARTFARVIDAAVCVVERVGEQTDAAAAVRALVRTFFTEDDLPPALRAPERTSSTRLSERPRTATGSGSTAPRFAAGRDGARSSRGRHSQPPSDPS
jgi:hypothetical protein